MQEEDVGRQRPRYGTRNEKRGVTNKGGGVVMSGVMYLMKVCGGVLEEVQREQFANNGHRVSIFRGKGRPECLAENWRICKTPYGDS
jgi:hypothetical protein